LSDTKDLNWCGSYTPSIDTEDRTDAETLVKAIQILDDFAPRLAMIHFKEPDTYGHGNNWEGYIGSIISTDKYVNDLWQYIQSDPDYADKTTLLITNDHGRHLDGIGSSFVGHGDHCLGCRHISLLALGPDFEKNLIVNSNYDQVDVSSTIATLLGFEWIGEGEPIIELLKN
jgi:phosphopentomutase